ELSLYTPPRTTTVAGGPRGSGPNQGPIPTSLQMMAHGNSNAHHFSEFYTANTIRLISLSSKRIWQMRLKVSLGWIWVLHVYIKNLIPLSLILLLFLLVGVFLSL